MKSLRLMKGNKRTVYLVDGSSYIHRAYHAIKHLSNSQGFPTNAVFGFTNMLLKLCGDKAPEYLAIVLDAGGPTFRHKIYRDYKANRPPMPEDLGIQIFTIKRILNAMNLKVIEREGFEADDIIGTLARLCEAEGFDVVMVTGDKDFRQLVTPATSMLDTMKNAVTDYATLKETYQLEPAKLVEVMGLSGDTSDNVPGVQGVGEKTALGLIRTFGSLEALYDDLEKVKQNRLKENLKRFKANAFLSRDLVRIDRFVPLEEGIKSLRVGEPDREALDDLFRDLEFKSLRERFARNPSRESEQQMRLHLSEEPGHGEPIVGERME
jgi:DNA polymerase-1